VPYSSRVGPIMVSPNPTSGAGSLRAAISSRRTFASALDRPPPPYGVGHSGAVQPRSAITLSQTCMSGLGYVARRPHQFPSPRPSIVPLLQDGGLSESHF